MSKRTALWGAIIGALLAVVWVAFDGWAVLIVVGLASLGWAIGMILDHPESLIGLLERWRDR